MIPSDMLVALAISDSDQPDQRPVTCELCGQPAYKEQWFAGIAQIVCETCYLREESRAALDERMRVMNTRVDQAKAGMFAITALVTSAAPRMTEAELTDALEHLKLCVSTHFANR